MMTAHSELSYVATQNKLSSDMTQNCRIYFLSVKFKRVLKTAIMFYLNSAKFHQKDRQSSLKFSGPADENGVCHYESAGSGTIPSLSKEKRKILQYALDPT